MKPQEQMALYEAVAPTGVAPGQNVGEQDPNVEQEASPEEQGMLDQFVMRAMKFIDNNQDHVIKMMNQSDAPVYRGVAQVAVKVGMAVRDTAKTAGQELTPDVLHNGGAQIIEILMETGEAAGIFPFTHEDAEYEEQMNLALVEATKIVGERILETDDGSLKNEAVDFMAQQVAREADEGNLDPNYVDSVKALTGAGETPVAAAVTKETGK